MAEVLTPITHGYEKDGKNERKEFNPGDTLTKRDVGEDAYNSLLEAGAISEGKKEEEPKPEPEQPGG